MEKSLKGISVFSLFVLLSLVSCQQGNLVSVSSPSDSSTQIASETQADLSSTQESTEGETYSQNTAKEEKSIESISLKVDKQYLKIGEKAKITADILPIDAFDKTVIYESSDTTIATVEGETVIALSEGKATINAYSKDRKVKASIDVFVIASQKDLLSLLTQAKEKERKESVKSIVTDEDGNSYESHAYTDGVQTKRTTAEGDTTILNISRSSVVHSLTLTSSDVIAEDLEINKDIDEQTAKDSTSLLEYYLKVEGTETASKIYGLSSIASNYLTGDYFGTKEALNNLRIIKNEDAYVVTTFTSGTDRTYLHNQMKTGFDSQKRLTSLEITLSYYYQTDFDVDNGKPKDNVLPKQAKSIKGSLEYGTRVETDSFKLNESDYKVKSFKIDTSKFLKEKDNNIMYLNESLSLAVTDEEPKIHLKENYSIESFSPTGIITADNNYFTARSLGTTTMTVTSSMGKTASIEIEVRKKPVESISFVGTVSSLKVGESASLSAYSSPYDVRDSPYTMKLKSAEQKTFASLVKDEKKQGSYVLTGLKEGQVTVVVYPDAYPDITSEMTVKIEAENKIEPPSSDLLKILVSKPYTDTYASVIFKEDGTGTLTNKYGGKALYSFSWILAKETITFSNIKLLSGKEQTSSTIRISNEYTKTGVLSIDGKTLTISKAMKSGNTFASNYEIKQK